MAAHIDRDSLGRKYAILLDLPEPLRTFASSFFPCSSINPRTGDDMGDDYIVWFELVGNWGNMYDLNQMVKNYLEGVK